METISLDWHVNTLNLQLRSAYGDPKMSHPTVLVCFQFLLLHVVRRVVSYSAGSFLARLRVFKCIRPCDKSMHSLELYLYLAIIYTNKKKKTVTNTVDRLPIFIQTNLANVEQSRRFKAVFGFV